MEFFEQREQFLPKQFRADRVENTAYTQCVAHSIQGWKTQTISDTPTCAL